MPQNNGRRARDQNEQRDQDDFRFEITRHFGVLSTSARGWIKELNLVKWNGREAKYDIREWQPDHQKMSKGVTMTREEIGELYELLESVVDDFQDDSASVDESTREIA